MPDPGDLPTTARAVLGAGVLRTQTHDGLQHSTPPQLPRHIHTPQNVLWGLQQFH